MHVSVRHLPGFASLLPLQAPQRDWQSSFSTNSFLHKQIWFDSFPPQTSGTSPLKYLVFHISIFPKRTSDRNEPPYSAEYLILRAHPKNHEEGREWNGLGKKEWARDQSLTLYTLTLVCVFSILFSVHFQRGWQGEFVSQSRVALVGDHLLYSHDFHVWFMGDIVGRN